jgi:hypothetical protein
MQLCETLKLVKIRVAYLHSFQEAYFRNINDIKTKTQRSNIIAQNHYETKTL